MENIKKIIDFLALHGYTVTTAESCTGGMISAAITDVPGASSVFEAGFVTYSNRMKAQLLSVPETVLESVGAVSGETVSAMSEGAARVSGANVAVAVSGIAGPGGGTPQKPVGLVYVGICIKDMKAEHKAAEGTFVYKCNFSGTRDQVRRQTVEKVFDEVARKLGL